MIPLSYHNLVVVVGMVVLPVAYRYIGLVLVSHHMALGGGRAQNMDILVEYSTPTCIYINDIANNKATLNSALPSLHNY